MGNTISGFENPLRPQRPPIAGQSGLQALFRAEQIDNYRKLVEESSINRLARLGQDYLPSRSSIGRTVPDADPAEPWPSGQVVWMDPTADAGLPHTRAPNLICISRDFPEADFKTTILHERIHVSQRIHPNAWKDIFSDVWSFKPWVGQFPADIEARRRINPDLLGAPFFIWKDTWVPVAIFKSTSRPKLNEVDIVWWNAKQRVIHRDPPPGWLDFFGNIPAGEHPYELSAYLIAANPRQNKAYDAIKPRLKSLPTTDTY
jgi:hypothetical protein